MRSDRLDSATTPHPGQRRARELRLSRLLLLAAVYLAAVAATVAAVNHGLLQPMQRAATQRHAEHLGGLTFQAMYSLMLTGGGREQIRGAALRLENAGPGVAIRLARGPALVEQFGDLRDSSALKRTQRIVRKALASGEPQHSRGAEGLTLAYPALFAAPCLECHTAGRVGEVAGVVVLDYPDSSGHAVPDPWLARLLLATAIGLGVLVAAVYRVGRCSR